MPPEDSIWRSPSELLNPKKDAPVHISGTVGAAWGGPVSLGEGSFFDRVKANAKTTVDGEIELLSAVTNFELPDSWPNLQPGKYNYLLESASSYELGTLTINDEYIQAGRTVRMGGRFPDNTSGLIFSMPAVASSAVAGGMGVAPTASGVNAAMGGGATVLGTSEMSLAAGYATRAGGNGCTSVGCGAMALGDMTTAIGASAASTGEGATAVGAGATARFGCIAIGAQARASNFSVLSTAIGFGCTSAYAGEFTVHNGLVDKSSRIVAWWKGDSTSTDGRFRDITGNLIAPALFGNAMSMGSGLATVQCSCKFTVGFVSANSAGDVNKTRVVQVDFEVCMMEDLTDPENRIPVDVVATPIQIKTIYAGASAPVVSFSLDSASRLLVTTSATETVQVAGVMEIHSTPLGYDIGSLIAMIAQASGPGGPGGRGPA